MNPGTACVVSLEKNVNVKHQHQHVLNQNKSPLFQPYIVDKLHSIPISVSMSLWGPGPTSGASADQHSITPVLNLYQKKTSDSKVPVCVCVSIC